MRYILEERFILYEDDDPRDNLNNETKAKAFDMTAPTAESSLSSVDWATKYEAIKSPTDKQTFWTQYLQVAFGKDASKAKQLVGSLDKYFQETNDSFDENNPVIYFLTHVGTGSFNKVNLGMVTSGSLTEIIKAFEADETALKTMQSAVESQFPSILGMPAFYTAAAKDQKTYLSIQKTLATKAKDDWTRAFGELCTAGGKLLPARVCKAQVDKKYKGAAKDIDGKADISDKQVQAILQKVETEPEKALAVAYDYAKSSHEGSIETAGKQLMAGTEGLKKKALEVNLSGEERERLGEIIRPKSLKHTAKSVAQLLFNLAVKAGLEKKPDKVS